MKKEKKIKESIILEKEFHSEVAAHFFRSKRGYEVDMLKEPEDIKQWRCKCGKSVGKKYNNLVCDRCGTKIKERMVRRIPNAWRITKEYKEWLKKNKKKEVGG